ncbi:MAG: EamA family transporter [Clostridiales bacterium]|nr:EamA family transporter [Clostridiales bacterium]
MSRTNAYVKNIAAMLIFGSIGIFVQAIPLRSSEIVAVRTILGSLFLCAILVIQRRKPDLVRVKKHLGMLLLSGVVLGSNWMFLFSAYQYTSVSVATLLYYCAPVIVLLLSPILFREKLTWSKFLGIAAAVIGMVLVNGTQTGGADPGRGLIYGLLAAVFYAGLILLNKRITDVPAVEKTLVQMLAAAVVMSAYAVLTHTGSWYLPQGTGLFALLIIGFVHTGIAYLLYISSMSELSGQTIALSSYIDPASALLFSAVFLQEQMTVIQLLGAMLILGGSAFGELFDRQGMSCG